MKTKGIFIVPLFLFLNSTLHAQSGATDTAIEEKDSSIEDRIYTEVEEEASYPGGMSAWVEYLTKNLRPVVPANRHAPAGTYKVIVQFIVSSDGDLSHIEPLTHYGYGMEEEVIRILKKSHKWLPAVQNGRHVNAYKRQPITFVIEEK